MLCKCLQLQMKWHLSGLSHPLGLFSKLNNSKRTHDAVLHCSEQSANVRCKVNIAIMKVNRWNGHCVGLLQYSSVQVTVCQVNVVTAGRCKSKNKLKYGQSFCYGGFVESLRSRQSLVTVPFFPVTP